jgi:hypothetical protein
MQNPDFTPKTELTYTRLLGLLSVDDLSKIDTLRAKRDKLAIKRANERREAYYTVYPSLTLDKIESMCARDRAREKELVPQYTEEDIIKLCRPRGVCDIFEAIPETQCLIDIICTNIQDHIDACTEMHNTLPVMVSFMRNKQHMCEHAQPEPQPTISDMEGDAPPIDIILGERECAPLSPAPMKAESNAQSEKVKSVSAAYEITNSAMFDLQHAFISLNRCFNQTTPVDPQKMKKRAKRVRDACVIAVEAIINARTVIKFAIDPIAE